MAILRALNRPLVAVLAVAAIAGGLRFANLGYPPGRIFDEVYYTKDACLYDGYGWKRCDITSSDEQYWVRMYGEVGSWVHPPLGKWAIALGEKMFGPDSFGWRFSAAVAGTLICVMTALIAQLFWGKPIWTFTAGLLIATEDLNFVQSRTGMLDIFVAFWVVLGFLLLILDRRYIDRGTSRRVPADVPAAVPLAGPVQSPAPSGIGASSAAPARLPADEPSTGSVGGLREADAAALGPPSLSLIPEHVPSPFWRPWRLLAGIAFGAAFATKWNGAYALVGAALLAFFWEIGRRRRASEPHPFWRTVLMESAGLIVAFIALPVIVYLASYVRFWDLHHGFDFSAWWKLQKAMEAFHHGLSRYVGNSHKLTHPYESTPLGWPIVERPVLYFFQETKNTVRDIISLGNPVIYWTSIFTVPYAIWKWIRRPDARAGLIVVAIFAQWLPWFLIFSRVQFFFYTTPIGPFLVLANVYAMRDLAELHVGGSRSRPYLPLVVAWVVLSVGMFVWQWPILTGYPVSYSGWQWRIFHISSWI
jgi:dolichyl-phosphate-mannose--protein O-mannosyl transferase